MTTLYLIRHAEAEGNAYRRIDGWYNSLITPNGLLQIEALRRRFEPIQIDACYASDLYRTCKTASAVYAPKNLPLHTDPRLREVEKLAVVLGTEGDGLASETIAACDYTVKIPMSHGVDSLNVAAASAVAFYQLGTLSGI